MPWTYNTTMESLQNCTFSWITTLQAPHTSPGSTSYQGRPIRVKHDAQMHHGQNRGSKKRKLSQKNVSFTKIGGKFLNFAQIGGKFLYFSKIGVNMQYASFIIIIKFSFIRTRTIPSVTDAGG